MKVRVDIMLKEGVLDPQGKAIGHALGNLGFDNVLDVRAGKAIMLDLNETDQAKAVESAKKMAEKLLANLVIEDFRVSVIAG
jgi:phosphoribosylformylglycinamidine synthase